MVVGKDSPSTLLRVNSRVVRVRQRDRALRVRELAHGAEGVSQEVIGGGVHLGNSTNTVEVLVRPVVEELGETCVAASSLSALNRPSEVIEECARRRGAPTN